MQAYATVVFAIILALFIAVSASGALSESIGRLSTAVALGSATR